VQPGLDVMVQSYRWPSARVGIATSGRRRSRTGKILRERRV
jgi:hypothetical protein